MTSPTAPVDTQTKHTPDREWLIWSNEHRAWWAPNRCGYTSDDRAAGRYSLDEAKDICCVRSWAGGVPPETILHESSLRFLERYPAARHPVKTKGAA